MDRPDRPQAFREETDPMPAPTPEQNQAFARIITHADRLFEALEDLAAAGGLRGLSGRIKPASIAKAAAALRSVRQAINDQLAELEGARPGPPGRDTLLPTAPSPTDPRPPAGPPDSVPIRRTETRATTEGSRTVRRERGPGRR